MARRWKNPLGFFPTSVTIILVVLYVAISAILLYIHHTVPNPPKKASQKGFNVTEAYRDLQALTGTYHPYNSHSNDEVRNWLLYRIESILSENSKEPESNANLAPATVFNDLESNATFSTIDNPKSVYFEGTNIIVYIRGSSDDESDWWNSTSVSEELPRKHGVLVNAHYDSVSTAFGATDDGVGIVTLLQLIRYYTTEGNQPKRGLVLLFNNGEEDFLNGAWAFMRHPISKFPDTFLNLEGAGAGGRAMMFRSTDTEVTRSYKKVPYPFATSISADSFKRRLIRSETDYVVFNGQLNLRGLDVAFLEPRAKYHTSEDNARDTSESSVWHMLSAAIATTRDLTSDTTTVYEPGEGTVPVYFDVLGYAFGLMELHTLFALSVTLLVVTPVAIIAVNMLLRRQDKSYLFARKTRSNPLDPHAPDEATVLNFGGWKGFTRYPIAFAAATAAVIGLALLIAKVNPGIVYSSQYVVWSMMLSAWFLVAWFFLRGSDFMRPSALQRAHAFGWIFTLSWLLLLIGTIMGSLSEITAGYISLIYLAGAFAAMLTGHLEFFALPARKDYATTAGPAQGESQPDTSGSAASGSGLLQSEDDGPGSSNRQQDGGENSEPTETTSLLGKSKRSGTRKDDRSQEQDEDEGESAKSMLKRKFPFGDEQEWSNALPSSLWILQLLLFAPWALIFVGPLALVSTSSLHQTFADGNSALLVYLLIAFYSILLLVPASPFFHRIPARLPILLFLVFIITFLYNLFAFPFSPQNRLKVYFRQDIDLDTGMNNVTLTGVDGYVQQVIASLPSSAGLAVHCSTPLISSRNGLISCAWQGLSPNVVPDSPITPVDPTPPRRRNVPISPGKQYDSWLKIKADRSANETEAKIKISGVNTRACRLLFDSPITDFEVKDAGEQDDRMVKVPPGGSQEIRLWSREWDRKWTVHVKWEDEIEPAGVPKKVKKKGLDGTAVCLWSDGNEKGVIPALDEFRMYAPEWSIVTKLDDGLVLGSKRFLL